MEDTGKINILIVCANGAIGRLITQESLTKKNLQVNILVRNRSKCEELAAQVEASGGLVHIADISIKEQVKDVTKGIHTVISCYKGFNACEYQKNILDDGLLNGLKVFVPADYSCLNCPMIKLGQNVFYDSILNFRAELAKTNVEGIHFHNGIFHEFYFNLPQINYYGTGDEPLTFTSYADTAKYVVEAVIKGRTGDVELIVDKMSMKELEKMYEEITGRKLNVVYQSIEEGHKLEQSYLEKGNIFQSALLNMLNSWAHGFGPCKPQNAEFDVVPGKIADFFATLK